MDHLTQQLTASPTWPVMALAAVAVVVGLILWLSGGKLLRPASVLGAAITGGFLGWSLLPRVLPQIVENVPTPMIGLAGGVAAGAGLGLALYRLTVAALSGATLAGAGLVAAAFLLPPAAEPTPGPTVSIAAIEGTISDLASRDAAGAAWKTTGELARSRWERLEEKGRARVLAGAGLGGVLGLLLGGLAPRRSSAIVTALLGSGVLLGGSWSLMHSLAIPGRELFTQGLVVNVVVWLALAAVGLAIQWPSRAPAGEPA